MPSSDLARLEPLTRRPLLLVPNRVYRVYLGGALIDQLQEAPEPKDTHLPEEWVGSSTVARNKGGGPEDGLSRVQLAGEETVLLKALIEAFPEAMLGPAHIAKHGRQLSVLCKLLDAAVRLPIQCHPDRVFARQHLHSDFGKTESWLIIGTREIGGVKPYILFGFREGMTEAEFRRITKDQDIRAQEEALNRIEVQPGEVYLVNAGTPHAIGSGVFMVEVQEPTDFVVCSEYDCGEIHLTEEECFMGLGFDLGMRCFNHQATGMDYVRQHTLAPRMLLDKPAAKEELLIGPEDTPCFGASRLTVHGSVADRDKGRGYIGIVLTGLGKITGPGFEVPLRPGATFFVPAVSEHDAYRVFSNMPLRIMKCFPPAA